MITNTIAVPIKKAQKCIAVRESYKSVNIYGTTRTAVDVTFCVDRNLRPCKICIFKSNRLVPVSSVNDLTLETLIRSKKGIYSVLDCVNYVCSLQAQIETRPEGRYWREINLQVYYPFGINGENLSATNIALNVAPKLHSDMQENIIRNIQNSIYSKEAFLGSRL